MPAKTPQILTEAFKKDLKDGFAVEQSLQDINVEGDPVLRGNGAGQYLRRIPESQDMTTGLFLKNILVFQ